MGELSFFHFLGTFTTYSPNGKHHATSTSSYEGVFFPSVFVPSGQARVNTAFLAEKYGWKICLIYSISHFMRYCPWLSSKGSLVICLNDFVTWSKKRQHLDETGTFFIDLITSLLTEDRRENILNFSLLNLCQSRRVFSTNIYRIRWYPLIIRNFVFLFYIWKETLPVILKFQSHKVLNHIRLQNSRNLLQMAGVFLYLRRTN